MKTTAATAKYSNRIIGPFSNRASPHLYAKYVMKQKTRYLAKNHILLKPEYRSHAVWLMNDRTALALHKLKDDAGNYLWNGNSDTILGKPVHICNDMPDIAAGAKPVLFGDFRYFWIIDRSPISMRAFKERFAMTDQVGYVGFELLDSRLVRKDAIKVLTVTA